MAAARPSPRIVAAVAALDPGAGERILEVGCGHGVALSLLAERPGGGRVTGIDRSAKMAAAARARNGEHLDAGRVRVEQSRFEDFDPAEERFDRIFAINVAPFWRADQAPSFLNRARKLLRPGGELFVFNQPPAWPQGAADRFASSLGAMLAGAGWEVTRTVTEAMPPAAMVGVAARPASRQR
ncbi:MAG TPA: class I SAM-dependent methyltransferase [Solirubrobacterales bacterium]|nr:class I SAM-dependent methyltransferase [Solirubrobacterales bacterium]